MSADPNAKELNVKVGTVKRTKKEYDMYLKEEVAQRAKIDTMKAEGADDADVKKQIEVLNDTLTVIPDTRQRLQKYREELQAFIAEHYPDVVDEESADATKMQVLESRKLVAEVASSLGLPGDGEDAGGAAGGDASGTGGTGDEF